MSLNQNPMLLCDFYKVGHTFQYPEKTTLVYSNLTPRSSRIEGVNEMVFFGLQYFIKEYLIDYFHRNFFSRDRDEVIAEYSRIVRNALGSDLPSYKHIEDLHKLGYLPIQIKAIPEGRAVPMRVPVLTIVNTRPEFYWVTNFIESLLLAVIWQPCTSATIAREYKRLLSDYAHRTGVPQDFVQWQGHDFSFRGLSSLETATVSGMAHLIYFFGTDTIPAINALEKYYGADSDYELVGGSVPATEHSVMCAGGADNEIETIRRLIEDVYPNGIVSIVSDSWDLWSVLTKYLPLLKDKIMARNGKIVIRPDSGDPADIICGTGIDTYIPSNRGVVELLWEVFGGTINEKGFKVLDPHVGVIYGDSITLKRAQNICDRLMVKGFASQVVFGIGSFTYQYNTRDTFGTAMKATYVEIDGVGKPIFKKPITDDGTKNSAIGLLSVKYNEFDEYVLLDNVSWQEEKDSCLQTVFRDGLLTREWTLAEVRANAHS